ncbi:MAG TPA: hypothetical protein VFO19_20300 [Vicinamibacterales bacterium]|nr:hypothetical protein [Vicinamibacterales bacterium]
MKATRCCKREADVLDAVAVGRWPLRADDELRSHVATCRTCADVASAASAVIELRDATPPDSLPDASVVWHRAQLKAREQATVRAAQPTLYAVGILGSCLAGLALAYWGIGTPWLASWWHALSGLTPEIPANLAATVRSIELGFIGRLIAATIVGWIVLVPVAVLVARWADR